MQWELFQTHILTSTYLPPSFLQVHGLLNSTDKTDIFSLDVRAFIPTYPPIYPHKPTGLLTSTCQPPSFLDVHGLLDSTDETDTFLLDVHACPPNHQPAHINLPSYSAYLPPSFLQVHGLLDSTDKPNTFSLDFAAYAPTRQSTHTNLHPCSAYLTPSLIQVHLPSYLHRHTYLFQVHGLLDSTDKTDTFSLDFAAPLSPLVALATCLCAQVCNVVPCSVM